jgi:DNA integrity scanning protein DisA with diadenylate cyclase activity
LLLLVDLAEVVKAHILLLHYLQLKLVVVILDQLNKVFLVERDPQMVDHILVQVFVTVVVEVVLVLLVSLEQIQNLESLKVMVELDSKLKLLEHHH